MHRSTSGVTKRIGALALAVLLLMTGACGGDSGDSSPRVDNAAVAWNKILLNSISSTKFGPPINARAIGIVQTAVYDAWAPYDEIAVGTRLGGSLRRPASERTRENKEIAISYAAYRALLDLYPSESANLRQAMLDRGLNPDDSSTDTATPQGIGNTVAAALLAYRHADGSNQLGDLHPGSYSDYTGYKPVNTADLVVDPSQWQQLRFANGASPEYITPHWGNVIPFSLASGSQLRPSGPPLFGSAEHLRQVADLVELTSSLTDEQKAIAEYWADGPRTVQPPGHWNLFAEFVSDRDGNSLDDDVKLYFALGNAVFEASIVCWDAKRAYNSSRPITAIRSIYAGQQLLSFVSPALGFGLVDGSEWLPYQSPNFITPPFPEYTSGHSTFSAAAAEVLRRFTGSDRFGYSVEIPAGSLAFEPNSPAAAVKLRWSTFSEAADQAGLSRRLGGIHFESGDLDGRAIGRQVGESVWNKAQAYINGIAN